MTSQTIIDFFDQTKDLHSFDWRSVRMPSAKQNVVDQFNWIMHESGIPWLKLDIEIPYQIMLDEAMSLAPMFVSHRDYGQGANPGWRSLCLHGLAWDRTLYFNNYPEYQHLSSDQEHLINYQWCPEVTSRCPVTVDFFKRVFPYDQYTRLRFMWLDPGASIEVHRDNLNKMLYPVNVALNNPPGCRFKMKDCGEVPLRKGGDACALDISNWHSVWNDSSIPRIHVIVHGRWGVGYQELIVRSFNKQLADMAN